MPTTAESVIATALHEEGYREAKSADGHYNNNTKYADAVKGLEWADFQPWCCTFVAWVAMTSGVADLYPRTASCDIAGLWFKARKRWSEYPAVGAQVFYGTPRDLSHTGIVERYDDDHVYTVEGNTNNTGSREGNGVYRKTRLRRDDYVVGYGYPLFPEGITSADPEFADGPPPTSTPGHSQGLPIHGVDISHWQSDALDWDAARRAGVRFVAHKATDGTSFVDEKYDARRVQVADAGLVWGGYHFARPDRSSGAKQAQIFLSQAMPTPGDLRPVLDLEKDGGLSAADLGAWATDFAEEVKLRVGVEPIIYTPFDLPARLGPLWVARYSRRNAAPRIPRPWTTYDIWQFSNGVFGKPHLVPGLGAVDINTLEAEDGLDKLRVPVQGVVGTAPLHVVRITRALAASERHAAALGSLRGPRSRPIAEDTLPVLLKERTKLEALLP